MITRKEELRRRAQWDRLSCPPTLRSSLRRVEVSPQQKTRSQFHLADTSLETSVRRDYGAQALKIIHFLIIFFASLELWEMDRDGRCYEISRLPAGFCPRSSKEGLDAVCCRYAWATIVTYE